MQNDIPVRIEDTHRATVLAQVQSEKPFDPIGQFLQPTLDRGDPHRHAVLRIQRNTTGACDFSRLFHSPPPFVVLSGPEGS